MFFIARLEELKSRTHVSLSEGQRHVSRWRNNKHLLPLNSLIKKKPIFTDCLSDTVYMIKSTYSSLSHVTDDGKAKMVDIGSKPETLRTATAQARVIVGKEVFKLISDNAIKKGDVLSIAQLAGIMAAKSTSQLIPLCHNILLNSVDVVCHLESSNNSVLIRSSVRTFGKTGAEMEALVAASVGALTVYDMCKAVYHGILITDVQLLSKCGGVRGNYQADT